MPVTISGDGGISGLGGLDGYDLQTQTLVVSGDTTIADQAAGRATLFCDASTNTVGINTTTPASGVFLEVADATDPIISINNTGNGETRLGCTTTVGYVGTNSAHDFAVRVNGVNRLLIDTDGKVGIADSSPSEILTVGSLSNSNSYIRVNSANNTEAGIKFYGDLGLAKGYSVGYEGDGNYFFIREDESGTISERLVINDAGYLGIGTTTPAVPLDVQGDVKIGVRNSTATTSLSIGEGASGDRISFIDLVSDTTYTDYAARLIRYGGATGETRLEHRGTGNFIIKGSDASNILLQTNSSTRLYITSGGNVGIGTTSPSQILHVVGDTYIDGALGVQQPSPGQGTRIHANSSANWNFAPVFIQRDASNTASNIKMLAFGLEADIASQTTPTYSCFIGLNTDSTPTTGDTVLSTNAKLNFTAPNGVIIPNGKVGIGTTGPNGKLEVNTASGAIFLAQGNVNNPNYPAYGFAGQNADNGTRGAGMYLPADNTLSFATTAVERIRINGNGNISFGGTSYLHSRLRLDGTNGSTSTGARGFGNTEIIPTTMSSYYIAFHSEPDPADGGAFNEVTHFKAQPQSTTSSITTQYGFWADASLTGAATNYGFYSNIASGGGKYNFYANGTANNYFAGPCAFGSNNNNPVANSVAGFAIRPEGYLICNIQSVNNPSLFRRDNDGDLIRFFHNNNSTDCGSISVTTSATAYNTSSDYRLKENVTPMTGAADRVKALKPCRFNFIADATKTVDGFIAHEAQTVVPEAVTGEKDGEEMQAIDNSKLVPLLTAALQEALAKINDLEARLTDAGL